MHDLHTKLGTGISVKESVPAALAIFKYTDGNLNESIEIAANLGGDTDTIASMVGAIAGAYQGIDEIDKKVLTQIIEVNKKIALEETIENYVMMLMEVKL